MGKKYLEELRELMPQIEKGGLCSADVGYIKDALDIAFGQIEFPSHLRRDYYKARARYLSIIANRHSHYKSKPKTQALLRQAVGLIRKLQ